MNKRNLAFGAVLLLIGILLYTSGHSTVVNYSGLAGIWARELSEIAEQQYQRGKTMEILGALLCLIGLIIAIQGAIAKSPKGKIESKAIYKEDYWWN